MKKLFLSSILFYTFSAFAQTPDSLIVLKVAIPPFTDSTWKPSDSTINYSKGNVGIGTGTVKPAAKFEILAGATKEHIRISSIDGIGTRYLSPSTFEYPIISYHAWKDDFLENATAEISITDRPGTFTNANTVRSSDILFKTAHNWNGSAFGQYMDNTMTVKASNDGGWVGIRTTTPDAALDVRGTVKFVTGTPASGKIWTATDNVGNGTWMTAPATYTDGQARSAISYTNLGNNGAGSYNSSTGTFNFPAYNITGLASFDSTKIKNLISAVPKADSAYFGYAFKGDSTFINGKWVTLLQVDSVKLSSEIIRVSGSSSGGGKVDTLTAQNVRGLKTFIGNTSSDAPTLTEQLSASGWTSTGWTGSFGAGWTHTVGNVTPLTNTIAATSGQYYQITWTVTGWTAGSFDISFGGVNSFMTGLTASGNSGPLAISTGTFSVTPTTTFDGTIVLSVKTIGASNPNTIWTASDGTNILQLRRPIAAGGLFIGNSSGRRVTTGTNNVSYGDQTLTNTTSGGGNTAVGVNSFNMNNIGTNNTGIGISSGQNTTSGYSNMFAGYFAGSANTTGFGNVGVGSLSLFNATVGSNNVAIGNNAGRYISTGSVALTTCYSCTFIGNDTRAGADGLSNVGAIGNGAVSPTTSNGIQIGNPAVTQVNISGQVGIANGTLSNSAVNLSQLQAAASSGTFAPTITAVTNVASSAPGSSVYIKSGSIVHCRFTGTVTPTATGVTVFNVTLPFSTATTSQSNIATISIEENGGASYVNGKAGVNAATTAQVRYLSTSATASTYTIEMDYQL